MPAINLCAGGCNRALRPSQPYTYREAVIMEQVSRTGGVGTVKSKEYTGRQFCQECGNPSVSPDLFGDDSS